MPSSLPLSTPPKPDQQVQKPLVNGTSPENCVNDVLGFISELYSMKSYMEIKNLFEHNKKLQAELDDEKSKCTKSMADLGRRVVEIGEVKKENERLTIESSGLRDENKKFQTESLGLKNQNKKLQTESSELKTQNKGLQTENSNHEKKAAEREEEKKKERAELSRLYLVEKDYEVTKTKLDEIKEEKKELEEEKKKLEKELEREKEQVKELNLIKSYSIGMSSCESKRSEATAVLRKICEEVFRFGKDFIYQELEQEVFHQERWENAKIQEIIVDAGIPVPSSNSIAGKQMRFVAGIMIIGKALQKYLFQPLYLDDDSKGLLDILDELSDDAEVHVRSVLLKALDDAQPDLVTEHARSVAANIMNGIGGFVPVNKLQKCEAEIMRICDYAVKGWKPFQTIEESPVAEYIYCEEEVKMWYNLRIPEPVQSPQSANAEGNNAGPSSNEGRSQAQGSSLMASKALKPKLEEVYEIWPAITAGSTPLYPGAIVTKPQLKDAEAEIEMEQSKQRAAKKKEQSNVPLATQRRRRGSEVPFPLGNGRNPGG